MLELWHALISTAVACVCLSRVWIVEPGGGIEAQPPQRDITLFVGSRTPFTPSLVFGTPSGECALWDRVDRGRSLLGSFLVAVRDLSEFFV